MSEAVSKSLSFQLHYTFAAPQERVFRAWTDADVFKRWFRPSGGVTISAEMDVRVGGAFQLGMQPTDGQPFVITGRYIEVQPPERLVMTWVAPPSGEAETVVTLEFLASGDATEVVLTHEGLPGRGSLLGFANGWRSALDGLDADLKS